MEQASTLPGPQFPHVVDEACGRCSQFSRSVVSDSATPRTAARQASLSVITNSRSLLKLMSIRLVMPSNHLILCHPLLLLPSREMLYWRKGVQDGVAGKEGRGQTHQPGSQAAMFMGSEGCKDGTYTGAAATQGL